MITVIIIIVTCIQSLCEGSMSWSYCHLALLFLCFLCSFGMSTWGRHAVLPDGCGCSHARISVLIGRLRPQFAFSAQIEIYAVLTSSGPQKHNLGNGMTWSVAEGTMHWKDDTLLAALWSIQPQCAIHFQFQFVIVFTCFAKSAKLWGAWPNL